MAWIVIGEKDGFVLLVSKSNEDGLLPKGSFLTAQQDDVKFILRVDKSNQTDPYMPSPLIVDMDLSGLIQDQKCQNVIYAFRVMDLSLRTDGKIDFIKPQTIARRSTQEEINQAMDNDNAKGAKVFMGTIHSGKNQLLVDDSGNFITAHLPEDMFYHQTLICGKTGSGKTVATKYLAQYFVQDMVEPGAVLAINVKEADFLKMDKESEVKTPSALREWEVLNASAKGIRNYSIYYPANTTMAEYERQGVDLQRCQPITLSVKSIDPEALTGLLRGITEAGAQSLPDIFRYWQNNDMGDNDRFVDFIAWFKEQFDSDKTNMQSLNRRGDEMSVNMHPSTGNSLQRILRHAAEYFDNTNALEVTADDILQRGKMSVIHVKDEMEFGAIVLRHLLNKIEDAKSKRKSTIPVLIIIDEVHNFYNNDAASETLGKLDKICRQGRSTEIGVIFSSQNPNDIPRGLESVINTKIFFKSDHISSKVARKITQDEVESLKQGYAVATIHELSQLKILKFPISFAGVFEK